MPMFRKFINAENVYVQIPDASFYSNRTLKMQSMNRNFISFIPCTVDDQLTTLGQTKMHSVVLREGKEARMLGKRTWWATAKDREECREFLNEAKTLYEL
jgi:hypothetical protein